MSNAQILNLTIFKTEKPETTSWLKKPITLRVEAERVADNVSADRFLRDEGLRTNGKDDLIVKDEAGRLWHFAVLNYSEDFGFMQAALALGGNTLCMKAGGGKEFCIKDMDEGYGPDQTADVRQILKQEEYNERCLQPYRRLRIPQNPKPAERTYDAIRSYCLGQFRETYDMPQFLADSSFFFILDQKVADCLGVKDRHGQETLEGLNSQQHECWKESVIRYCANPPQELGLTRNICEPESSKPEPLDIQWQDK